jgi:hypothetical protein
MPDKVPKRQVAPDSQPPHQLRRFDSGPELHNFWRQYGADGYVVVA